MLKYRLERGRSTLKSKVPENLPYPADKTAPEPVRLHRANPAYPTLDSRLSVRLVPGRGRVHPQTRKPGVGRGVVADEYITCGEIVAVEEPLLHRLCTSSSTEGLELTPARSACYACLRYTAHLLPCDGCCAVMFCSPSCHDGARRRDGSHGRECGLGLFAMRSANVYTGYERWPELALHYMIGKPMSWFLERKRSSAYLQEAKLGRFSGKLTYT